MELWMFPGWCGDVLTDLLLSSALCVGLERHTTLVVLVNLGVLDHLRTYKTLRLLLLDALIKRCSGIYCVFRESTLLSSGSWVASLPLRSRTSCGSWNGAMSYEKQTKKEKKTQVQSCKKILPVTLDQ